MHNLTKDQKWKVKFEVTFYGNDPNRGSFREIKESSILFSDKFDTPILKNQLGDSAGVFGACML